MDEQILKLKEKLLYEINNSNLPITVISLIITELQCAINNRQEQVIREIRLKKIEELKEKEKRK